jgi:hypothetical protein
MQTHVYVGEAAIGLTLHYRVQEYWKCLERKLGKECTFGMSIDFGEVLCLGVCWKQLGLI